MTAPGTNGCRLLRITLLRNSGDNRPRLIQS
jgi:hypothetical protein